jgi:hypothetical protein
MTLIRMGRWFREPSAINAAQTFAYIIVALTGAAAAAGALSPLFLSLTIGPIIITVVGTTMAVGGVIGAFAVTKGLWWLERIALIITGCGWAMLLVPAVFYAFNSHNSSIFLVLALVVTALCDVFKRYRRIDWAYLDPSK